MADDSLYVPVHVGIWSSPKMLELEALTSCPQVYLVGHLVALWHHAALHFPDGVLRCKPAVVELAAKWSGDRGALLAALVECGMLDKDGDGLAIHGWADYAGKGMTKRAKEKERKRKARANIGTSEDKPDPSADCPRDVRGQSADVRGTVPFVPPRDGEGEGEGDTREFRAQAPASEPPPVAGPLSPAAMTWCQAVADARPGFFNDPAVIAETHGEELRRLEVKPGFAECVTDQIEGGKVGKGIGRGPISYLTRMVANWTPKRPRQRKAVDHQAHLCPMSPGLTQEQLDAAPILADGEW